MTTNPKQTAEELAHEACKIRYQVPNTKTGGQDERTTPGIGEKQWADGYKIGRTQFAQEVREWARENAMAHSKGGGVITNMIALSQIEYYLEEFLKGRE